MSGIPDVSDVLDLQSTVQGKAGIFICPYAIASVTATLLLGAIVLIGMKYEL